jgi:hypothetical protein
MRSPALAVVVACVLVIGCTKFETPRDGGIEVNADVVTGSGQDGGDDANDDSDRRPPADALGESTPDGGCRHDCLGGECIAGQCQPVLLARLTSSQLRLAVGSTAVYSGDSGATIARTPKDGSAGNPQYITDAATYLRFFQDGTRVFWVATSGLQMTSCEEMSCATTRTTLGPPMIGDAPTLDDSGHRVYWRDTSDNHVLGASTVGTWSPAALTPTTYLAGSSRMIYRAGYLYAVSETALLRVSAAGGNTTTLATGTFEPDSSALAIADGFAYWRSGDSIVFVPLPSGVGQRAPDKLTDVASIVAIAGDADSVYWATQQTIETCAAAGCGGSRPTVLVAGFSNAITDIGLDDQAVYATTSATILPDGSFAAGTVWKLAR